MAKRNKTKCDCPKCSGTGRIQAFSHIASGQCFMCKGVGYVMVDLEARKNKLSDTVRKQADWVMASTEESYEGLSYGKLLKIRDFCHGGWGVDKAYPELLNHWRKVGEGAFQAAQAKKHEAYMAKLWN